MTEIVGDIVQPSELIIPTSDGTGGNQPTLSGAIFMSGVNLAFYDGAEVRLLSGIAVG